MAGLIAEILLCCSLFIALCSGMKMSDNKTYWLMDYLLINSCVHQEYLALVVIMVTILSFEVGIKRQPKKN